MVRIPVDERRRALIDAAVHVISDRGLAAASTRAIVAEANMSLASFHYAFESREELLDLLLTEVLSHEEKAILPENFSDKSLHELIEAGLLGYLEHLRTNPAREQAMLELTQFALRERVALARNQYAQYLGIASPALEYAAQATNQRWAVPLDTVASLLLSFTDGITLSWLVNRDDPSARLVCRAAAQAVASLAEPCVPGAFAAASPGTNTENLT